MDILEEQNFYVPHLCGPTTWKRRAPELHRIWRDAEAGKGRSV